MVAALNRTNWTRLDSFRMAHKVDIDYGFGMIYSIAKKGGSSNSMCLLNKNRQPEWTHACSKLYLLLFISFSCFFLVLPHNLINKTTLWERRTLFRWCNLTFTRCLVEMCSLSHWFIILGTYLVGILLYIPRIFNWKWAFCRFNAGFEARHTAIQLLHFSFYILQRAVSDWMTSSWWIRANRRTAFAHKKIISHFESGLCCLMINNAVEILQFIRCMEHIGSAKTSVEKCIRLNVTMLQAQTQSR